MQEEERERERVTIGEEQKSVALWAGQMKLRDAQMKHSDNLVFYHSNRNPNKDAKTGIQEYGSGDGMFQGEKTRPSACW